MDTVEPTATDAVEYRVDGDVATVTLTRPDRLNAVTKELYAGLLGALEQASADEARVIVLQGAGRAFCVGADLKNHDERDRTAAEKREYAWAAQHACRAIQTHERPVIAKVQGYAIGAGAEMALSADLIVMADDAEMRFPEAGIGTYVGGGVTYRLPERVGTATAKRLLLTAASVGGEEAAEIGLVDETVPAADLDAAVDDLAGEIAGNAPIPVAFAKEQLNRRPDDPEHALTAEVDALLTCMETDDWQEGVDAFAEDREPIFEGR
ncbi:enoyl-CoA hydratase/isomerase family protein [Natronolimnohabitans sp. A-GB9]|uniref:enoyl-CoA hydratase/isomerase family protein n=1 Tax=Natronolimnohabitans sp. A-GB9 TaxID=3069757 RepID=UPI0027B00FC2|nr:enoyl-CoA hydratase/isomerase family protein [Natronolimnohabitans sp. A-GB9]MDQ2050871.1 enoyl-CoA hydratase/isomerase family protein [Natronolimnohabitans sp. A-GB9]